MKLTDKITKLPQIGNKRKELFLRLNIETIEDLLSFYPRTYEDLSLLLTIEEAKARASHLLAEQKKEKITLLGTFTKPSVYYKKGQAIVTSTFRDESDSISITWFNQAHIPKNIKKDTNYYVSGTVSFYKGNAMMIAPIFEKYSADPATVGKILPIYPLTKGLTEHMVRQTVQNGLKTYASCLEEYLPDNLRKEANLCEYEKAVTAIHFPNSMEEKEKARTRLAFDELFLMQMSLLYMKKESVIPSKIVLEGVELGPLYAQFPYELTEAQKKVMKEIMADLASGFTMNRLVQGDVGSGKTAVSMVSAYILIKNKRQVAFMAPTEVLAKQHYQSFSKVFAPLGIQTALLVGGSKTKEKKELLKNIAAGTIDMIIGTHALIQEEVEYKELGLIMTDEQHRFGVKQRSKLSQKGENPHVLLFSATPIPRTLGLVVYGDLDVSIIDEMPPGRQTIKTYGVSTAFRNRLKIFMEKEVKAGRQGYIICPLIDHREEGNENLMSVMEMKAYYDEYSNLKTAVMHGELPKEEKEKTMAAFLQGKIDVLISTTVIEVGVDVPNATVMIVENAERFGLSQLHQLRGRVGRGKSQSYCILMTEAKNKEALQRVRWLTEESDGFVIAEKDMELRGLGNFFGTEQHGLLPLKIANLYTDTDILLQSKEIATKYVDNEYGEVKSMERKIKTYVDKISQIGL